MSDDEKILIRVPGKLWEWIDSRAWHMDEWEQFRNVSLGRAPKCTRALLMLYNWMHAVPAYNTRRGKEVTITFDSEDQAQIFCAMLAKEKRRQELDDRQN